MHASVATAHQALERASLAGLDLRRVFFADARFAVERFAATASPSPLMVAMRSGSSEYRLLRRLGRSLRSSVFSLAMVVRRRAASDSEALSSCTASRVSPAILENLAT